MGWHSKYPLVSSQTWRAAGKSSLNGGVKQVKSSIHGVFSIATLDYQRVTIVNGGSEPLVRSIGDISIVNGCFYWG